MINTLDKLGFHPDSNNRLKHQAPISSILVSALLTSTQPPSELKMLPSRAPELKRKIIIEAITESRKKIISEFANLTEADLDRFLRDKLNEDLVPAFQNLLRFD